MEESKFMPFPPLPSPSPLPPPHHTKGCKISGLCHGWMISSFALNVSPSNFLSFKAFSSSVLSMDNRLLKIVEGSIKCKLHKRRKDKPMLGFVNISSHNSSFFLIRIENHYRYPKRSSISIFNSFVLQRYKSIKAYRRRYTERGRLVWQYNKTKSILFFGSCISQGCQLS